MPIADWTVPMELTSAVYSGTTLKINQARPAGTGVFLLRPDGCQLNATTRLTKDNIPQADGSILHRRFLTGMEMKLAIQLWQDFGDSLPACDELLQSMLDELLGYLAALINAGDNEGRISWTPAGENARMLDDIRLYTYPVENIVGGSAGLEIAVTIDCALPYSEDLTQLEVTMGASTALTNGGNRPTYVVYALDGPFTTVTVDNTTTGTQFVYDGAQAGALSVGGGSYLEIDTFRNTATIKVGAYPAGVATYNASPGIVMTSSEFEPLPPGSSTVTLNGGVTGRALINAAWA